MSAENGAGAVVAMGIGLIGLAALALGLSAPPSQDLLMAPQEDKLVAVPADSGWVDTGIDVFPGEVVRLTASGEINLQTGNPEAVCGPAGLDLITVEQPVPGANLGALIGKVVQLVARRVDEDSGAEIRDEIFVLFPVGPECVLTVPLKGRLHLGINENVLRDNGGAYSVIISRRPA